MGPGRSSLASAVATVTVAAVLTMVAPPIRPAVPAASAATPPSVTSPAPGTATKDPTPTIAGVGEPGDTIGVLTDNGRRLCSPDPVVQPDGVWRCVVNRPLPDGPTRVIPVSVSGLGTFSAGASLEFEIDTMPPPPPTVTFPFEGTLLANNRPTFIGTAEADGYLYVVDNNDAIIGSPAVGPRGTWSFVPTRALADGTHAVLALEEDNAGNLSEPSRRRIVVIDTTAPRPPRITAPAPGTRTGITRPAVAGTGEPGAVVIVFDEAGRRVCSSVVAATGRWTCALPVAFAAGVHAVSSTQTDRAGNVSAAGPLTSFAVGPALPAPKITTPAPGAATNHVMPTVAGIGGPRTKVSVLDERGSPVCTPEPVVTEAGTWTCTARTPFPVGRHVLTPRSAGGVPKAGPSVEFTVDLTAPAAPVITSPVTGSDYVSRTPVISGTGETGATVTVLDETGRTVCTPEPVVTAAGQWTCTPSTRFVVAGHTLTPTQTDPAGNRSEAGATVSISVEAAAPTLTTSAPGSRTNDVSPTITGTGDPGNTVTVVDADGNPVCTSDPIVGVDGRWTCTSRVLPDGPHRLFARQTDPDGTRSQTSSALTLTVDTDPPAAPAFTSPARGTRLTDRTPTIAGTGEPGAFVVVLDDDGDLFGTATVASDGTWSVTPLAALPDATHTLRASQTDAAGNVSAPSAYLSFVVSAPAPVSSPAPRTSTPRTSTPRTAVVAPPAPAPGTTATPGRAVSPQVARAAAPATPGTADTGVDGGAAVLLGGLLVLTGAGVLGAGLACRVRRRRAPHPGAGTGPLS